MQSESLVKDAILEKYKSVRAFTQELGIPYSTVDSLLKNGIGGTAVQTAVKICRALDLDLENVVCGENTSESNSLSTVEIEKINKYRTLDAHGKKLVDMVLDTEYKRVASQMSPVELPTSPKEALAEAIERDSRLGGAAAFGGQSTVIEMTADETKEALEIIKRRSKE